MPPRPDNAARTHHPRGPSGAARGCEALLRPENHRVFRMILAHYWLRVDGKRDQLYNLLRRLRQGADGGALLHSVGVAPGDLGVGEEVAAPDIGVVIGVVDAGRDAAVLLEGAGGAQ